MEKCIRVRVLKGFAAREVTEVEVKKESLVFEFMLHMHKKIGLHWRRQRYFFNGRILEEDQPWSQLQELVELVISEDGLPEDTEISVQLVHVDHRKLEPIEDYQKMQVMLNYSGEALRFASNELQDDAHLVALAVATYPRAFTQYASEGVKHNQMVAELAMRKDPSVFRSLVGMLRANRKLAMKAVDADPGLMKFCHEDLFRDKIFLKHCVQKSPSLLRFARCSLEFSTLLSAVKQDGMVLPFAAMCLEDDVQFPLLAMEAVEDAMPAIQFVQEKAVLEQILKAHPHALQFVDAKFQDDLDLVGVAYDSDPSSLKHCKLAVVVEMIRRHGTEVIDRLTPELQLD